MNSVPPGLDDSRLDLALRALGEVLLEIARNRPHGAGVTTCTSHAAPVAGPSPTPAMWPALLEMPSPR